MKKTALIFFILILFQGLKAIEPDYEWTSPSHNSSESMPCGGSGIGMNVWVENGDILFYIAQNGSYDENNTLLKQGRFRLKLTPSPFLNSSDFRQILKVNDGYVEISGGGTIVHF